MPNKHKDTSKTPHRKKSDNNYLELADDPCKVLLTTKQAAAFLECAAITLNLSRCSGTLFGMTAPPFIKRGKNGRVFYKLSTLKKFNSQFKEQANTAVAYGVVE